MRCYATPDERLRSIAEVVARLLPHPHGDDLPIHVVRVLARRQPEGWARSAACAQFDGPLTPDAWHPASETSRAAAAAIAVCARCPVAGACRAWALQVGERDGIWGGLTPTERQHRRARLAQLEDWGEVAAVLDAPAPDPDTSSATRWPRRRAS